MKQIIYLSVLILLSISVYASVDVTYSFDQQNVAVVAVDCLNADCSSIRQFSGQIIKGPAVTDGLVIVRYPDSLATQFGYAEFFTSAGFRPLVGKHDWHSFGQSGIGTAQESSVFSKMPNVCHASVSQLLINSAVPPNQPIVINTAAQLDTTTAGAFQLLNTGVSHIPQSLLQEYWGADTVVRLEILNGIQIINSQQKDFAASTNNAIIANSVVPVSFTFTPDTTGSFVARVTASVVDSQCASQEDQKVEAQFVVQSPPQVILPFEVTIVPGNGALLNASSLPITATTNIAATCHWDRNNVGESSMVNAFATTDGLTHTTTITGLALGNNNIFVACNNQLSTTNLMYRVENIIENSVITNSTITNSIITNSTIINAVVTDAIIVNNTITNGTITTNWITYNATTQGSLQLSQLQPLPPVASFTQSHTIAQQGHEVTFTSTSTDPNIPGPLNDVLTFVWDFGDGTSATGVSVAKRYSSEGTFTVKFIVTDRFNLSSTVQKTITIVRGNSESNSNSGSGGGGGSSSSVRSAREPAKIVVANVVPVKKPVIRNTGAAVVQPVIEVEQNYEPIKLLKVKKNNDFLIIEILVFLNVVLLGVTAHVTLKLIRQR